MLTGDSLFVGDAARPDLAIEARAGAEGLFHSLRRLAELPDGVEVYPGSRRRLALRRGHELEGVVDDRLRAALQPRDDDRDEEDFVEESAGGSQLRPPNMERIVALNRGPFVGVAAAARAARRTPTAPTIVDVRDADTFAAGHAHGAINVPVDGSSFSTKSAFLLVAGRGDRRSTRRARTRRSARREGCAPSRCSTSPGTTLDPPRDEQLAPIELDEVERLLAAGEIEVLDVREKDERDGGYIAGTRNIPYRLLRVCGDRFGEKPVVTICNTGARAAIAASVLARAASRRGPSSTAASTTGRSAAAHTVEFRRCGT